MLSTPRDDPTTLGVVTQPTPQPGYYQPYPLQMPTKRGMSTLAILGVVFGAMFLGCLGIGGAIAVFGSDPKRPNAIENAGTPTAPAAEATTPAAKGPVVAKLGEELVSTSLGSEVHYILNPGSKVTRTKFGTKAEKGQFFALSVTVRVVEGSAYVYGGDFALITPSGTPYEGSASGLVDGGLEGVQANAGQTVTGLVVFDVPTGAEKAAKVELRELFASNQAFWQLP